MALKRVAGACFVKRDGVQYSVRGSLNIDPLSVVREPMVGMDGPHGYKETPKMPSISVSVTKNEELSLTAFRNVTGSTITAEVADGTVYVLSDAFQSGDLQLNADDGTVTLTFHGRTMTEI